MLFFAARQAADPGCRMLGSAPQTARAGDARRGPALPGAAAWPRQTAKGRNRPNGAATRVAEFGVSVHVARVMCIRKRPRGFHSEVWRQLWPRQVSFRRLAIDPRGWPHPACGRLAKGAPSGADGRHRIPDSGASWRARAGVPRGAGTAARPQASRPGKGGFFGTGRKLPNRSLRRRGPARTVRGH